jgi:hypothetical protein
MKTVEGAELDDAKYLPLLAPGEALAFAARLAFASVNGGPDWREPFLILTSQRLIISKDKLFGKPKLDYAITWPEVSTVDNGPWNGTFNPLVQLDVRTARGTLALPVRTLYAADVESAIRAGYLSNPGHPANLR